MGPVISAGFMKEGFLLLFYSQGLEHHSHLTNN